MLWQFALLGRQVKDDLHAGSRLAEGNRLRDDGRYHAQQPGKHDGTGLFRKVVYKPSLPLGSMRSRWLSAAAY